MRWNTFVRSAGFAALAALGWLPWALLVAPIAGVWNARALYLVVTAVIYAAGLSPRPTRRAAVGTVMAVAGIALVAAVRTTGEVALGLAVLLGITRSVFLYRAAPARALAREVCLLGGGLVFARFLAAATPASTALALWGFLLVQSFFFLAGGGAPARPAMRSRVDPFEEAYHRAVALLERTAV
jgi:hypothetical protein